MSTLENWQEVESPEGFKEQLSKDLNRISLINFWAPWAEPCKQMNEVALELAKKYPTLLVLQVDAEQLPDISESFEIESVPSFLLLRGHTLLQRIVGADAPALTNAVAQHARATPVAQSKTDQAPAVGSNTGGTEAAVTEEKAEETEEQLNERLRGLMNQAPVVLFMKGNPDAPRCGFSRQTVAILREQNVDFKHFDILTDQSVRSGLKVLNDWPTFPQVIVKGELIGGLDILKEMVGNGELNALVS